MTFKCWNKREVRAESKKQSDEDFNMSLENGISVHRHHLAETVVNQLESYRSYIKKCSGHDIVGSHNNYTRVRKILNLSELERIYVNLGPCIAMLDNLIKAQTPHKTQVKERDLLKRFLSQSQIVIPSHLDQHIEDEDIIEVYDEQAIQCYRSFNFFEICSYSLEDIFSYPWWNLYERNVFVTRTIGNLFSEIVAKGLKEPLHVDVPDHVVREIWSLGQSTLKVRQRVLFPLQSQVSKMNYCMATFRVIEKISKVPNPYQSQ